MKCGGISNEEKPAGEDIQQIVNSVFFIYIRI
jgi:hypothetical protein